MARLTACVLAASALAGITLAILVLPAPAEAARYSNTQPPPPGFRQDRYGSQYNYRKPRTVRAPRAPRYKPMIARGALVVR